MIRRRSIASFTLTELLVVIAIMCLLAALSVPAMKGLKGAGDFTKAAYDISDSIAFARTYAMANNTYTFLGIAELDRSQPASANPQKTGNGGLIALGLVSSLDGTTNSVSANLTQVSPIQAFDLVHMTKEFPTPPAKGGMSRPGSNPEDSVTRFDVTTSQPDVFSLPPNGATVGKYPFSHAIRFNSLGTPALWDQSSENPSGNPWPTLQWIEIELQPMSGNVPPPAPTDANHGNQAAILIDGATGSTRLYRP